VRGRLKSHDVTPAHAGKATCGEARRVMRRVVALRLEEDRTVRGFVCHTDVLGYHPLIADYQCRYRDPDSLMGARLMFTPAYYGKDTVSESR
jgi:hypothetical protein